jgi:hypothetical protein
VLCWLIKARFIIPKMIIIIADTIVNFIFVKIK